MSCLCVNELYDNFRDLHAMHLVQMLILRKKTQICCNKSFAKTLIVVNNAMSNVSLLLTSINLSLFKTSLIRTLSLVQYLATSMLIGILLARFPTLPSVKSASDTLFNLVKRSMSFK